MKFQIATTALAAASVTALATSNANNLNKREVDLVDGTKIMMNEDVVNSAAYEKFITSEVRIQHAPTSSKRQQPVTPDYIFVLQCAGGGFRDPCLVFGAPPGLCVSYFDFQPANSTVVSDVYWKNVSSLVTNTGGYGMFYHDTGCDILGNDRGVTLKYIYNFAVPPPDDPRVIGYDKNITSWRC